MKRQDWQEPMYRKSINKGAALQQTVYTIPPLPLLPLLPRPGKIFPQNQPKKSVIQIQIQYRYTFLYPSPNYRVYFEQKKNWINVQKKDFFHNIFCLELLTARKFPLLATEGVFKHTGRLEYRFNVICTEKWQVLQCQFNTTTYLWSCLKITFPYK